MSTFTKYNSYIGTFLLGALISGLFFAGQLQEPRVAWHDSSKRLTAAVMLLDYKESDPLKIVRENQTFESQEVATTSRATTTLVVATSSATTSEEIVESEEADEVVVEEIVEIAEFNIEPEVIEEEEIETVAQEVVIEVDEEIVADALVEEERQLPEGVYVLANGDYVDRNGDLISGDPFLFDYQPPNEEEHFTTPGGVVMDRFGVIHFQPDVVDESLVLIPPTIIDPDNPPSTISPIYIPRYAMAAINRNPLLNCVQIQLYGNDRALCELFKEREDDYEWIRVDKIDE